MYYNTEENEGFFKTVERYIDLHNMALCIDLV